ncbi:MAG: hypothetical protein C0621_00340 [Desulfuromonas sp.]|nr:MAG: hypothetical protein C0621_00340 [Desulfuromonas sp.]
MKRLVFTVLILLLTCAPLTAEVLDRIVAVVNGEIITSIQRDRLVEQRRASAPIGTSDKALQQEALDTLIEEKLIGQRGKSLGLGVETAEVDAAIDDVLRQNSISREQLQAALEQQGVRFADYEEELRRQILRFKVIGRDMQQNRDVSQFEIERYYDEYQDEFRLPETLSLSRLSLFLAEDLTPEEHTEQLKQVEALRSSLLLGTPITDLLAADKDGRLDGGEMGNLPLKDLTPTFRQAVEGLVEGQVSDPIETPKALHLLQVLSRTPGSIKPLEEVKASIRQKLVKEKGEQGVQGWLDNLRSRAKIERRAP